MALVAVAARNGQPAGAMLDGFDVQSLYGDGLNLYAFARSNPINGRDPLGLNSDFDYFQEVDDINSEIIGNRVATLGEIRGAAFQSFNAALLLGQLAVGFLPGGDALLLMGKLAAGADVTWDELAGAGLSVVGLGIVGKITGKYLFAKRSYGVSRGTAVALKYKSFTRKYFRHNLKVRTGVDAPSTLQAHHVFPQAPKLESKFRRGGININNPQYGAWWPTPDHQQRAHEYNAMWDLFFRNNSNPSGSRILQEGREIMKHFGFPVDF